MLLGDRSGDSSSGGCCRGVSPEKTELVNSGDSGSAAPKVKPANEAGGLPLGGL